MRSRVLLAPLGLVALSCFGQGGYDLHAIDSVLDASYSTLYAGNVVCMVAHDDSLVYYRAYGNYDSTSQALVASVSKTFSSTLLLSLAGDGLLSLDDTLGTYLPSSTAHGTGNCTLRQCFSHSAGWPENDSPYTYMSNLFYTLHRCADSLLEHLTYQYPPGTAFDYGGVSMQLAGAAAEVAAGDNWDALFNARIAAPLGLQHSDYFGAGPLNPNIAGGMRSSPNDLMKLASMILHNGNYQGQQIVPADLTDAYWTDQTNAAPVIYSPFPAHPPFNPYNADTVRYGLGCWLDIQRPDGYVEAMSADGAFGTSMFVDRCHHLTGVVFTLSSITLTMVPNLLIERIVRDAVPSDCLNTAVTPSATKADVLMAPNPATEGVNVRTPTGWSGQLEVRDLRGRSVLGVAVNSTHTFFSVGSLAPGTYLVTFTSAGGEALPAQRLVVAHALQDAFFVR